MSPAEGGFSSPRILAAFAVATLIWGSTWFVILGQFGRVPAVWSVTYRFAIASAALFAWAVWRRAPLRLGGRGQLWAAAFGIPQFCLNYNAVYAAEHFVTSGLVAVVFALLVVPNSAMARLFLGHRLSGRFLLGSAVAMAGVVLLFVQEVRTSGAGPRGVLVGIGFTLLAILSASAANTMQAAEALRRHAIPSILAWGMVWGTATNALIAFALAGPPVIDTAPLYWAGLLYLALLASALAFVLYYQVIRAVGPARAAYSSLLVPIIAMAFSTAFEGYRWSIWAVAGGVLALSGLFIALRSARPRPEEAG
ncbi:MAG: DMT family transporter [Alphaproteobacteria bacterium]|nr:DMT family transporter [Alphaproteobacteria bacterium]